ncbi:general odorant-binding protein 28a-like [Cochliomyia hominivorax]
MEFFKIVIGTLFFSLISISIAAKSAQNGNEAARRFQLTLEICKDEVGATTADIQDLLNRRPATTSTGKCFRSCLMKKYNVMDSDGKFDKSVALKEAHKLTKGDANKMKLAEDLTNACGDIEVSSDHCKAAADYGECFREQIKILTLAQR